MKLTNIILLSFKFLTLTLLILYNNSSILFVTIQTFSILP